MYVVAVLYCVIFCSSEVYAATNPNDTAPPEVEIIEQDFGEVTVGDVITIQVKITDESKIYVAGDGYIKTDKGIGDTIHVIEFNLTDTENIYESKVTITEKMQPGEWYLESYINCEDVNGNKINTISYNSYTSSPVKFMVVNNDFDPIAPVVKKVELVVDDNVVENDANVTMGETIKIQMDIQEDSGILDKSYIKIESEESGNIYSYTLLYNKENNKYETEEIEITEKIRTGIWYITYYSIIDTKENELSKIFSKEESPLRYVVVNDEYDTIAPVIHEVIVDKNKQTIYPNDTVSIIVDATDNKGIASVEVIFSEKTYSLLWDEEISKYSIEIPMEGIKVGHKNISVVVKDKRGNEAYNSENWVKLDTPTYDDMPPVIENVAITMDKAGEILEPGDIFTVIVELDAYDDYGISEVYVKLFGIDGDSNYNGVSGISLVSESSESNRYEFNYTIEEYIKLGEYYINGIVVTDISGNHSTYEVDDSLPYYFYAKVKERVDIPIYEVTFYGRGNEIIKTETVVRRDTIVIPDAPKISGYKFDGWRSSLANDWQFRYQPGDIVPMVGRALENFENKVAFTARYSTDSVNKPGTDDKPSTNPDDSSSDDSSDDSDDSDTIEDSNSVITESISNTSSAITEKQIINQIQSTPENGKVIVDMVNSTKISAEVLNALKNKNMDLVLDMGNYTWTINGKDLWSTNLKEIDFGVKAGTVNVPQEIVDSVAKENPSMQIQLNHMGSFGLKAELSIKIDKTHVGKNGYLYYYDSKGRMKFVDAGKVDENGILQLDFNHASDYVLVFSTKDMLPEKWIQADRKWSYQNADGNNPFLEWKWINNKWYYFNADSYIATGWIKQEDSWYYLNVDNGDMQTGWVELDNKWYYLLEDGKMKKGWLLYDGRWFYLKENGEMAVGWIKENGKWYYMTEDGAWIYS